MSRQQLKARDKLRRKMTKDGLVEINETQGEVKRISSREAELSLQGGSTARESFSRRGNHGEAPKKRKLRGQRQWNNEPPRDSQAVPQSDQQEYMQEHGSLTPQTEAEQAPVPRNAEPPRETQAGKRNARYRAEAEASNGEVMPDTPHKPIYRDGEPPKLKHDVPIRDDAPTPALSHEAPAPMLRHECTSPFDRQPNVRDSKRPRRSGQRGNAAVQNPEQARAFAEKQPDSQLRHEQRDIPLRHDRQDAPTPSGQKDTRPPFKRHDTPLRHNPQPQSEQRDIPPHHQRQDVPLRHERTDAPPDTRPGAPATRDQQNTRSRQPRQEQKNAPARHSQPTSPQRPNQSTVPPERGQAISPVQSTESRRLRFTAEEAAPSAKPNRAEKQLAKAERGAERITAKLEAAQSKLPTKKRLRSERVFDETTGTAKRRLRFETGVKPQGEHIRGALPLRPVKAAGNAAIAFGHRKLYQVQHENVGTEAAHKLEMAAEGGVRAALRLHKTAPYRKVARLERAAAKKSMKLSYQRALADNLPDGLRPKLRSNPVSRFVQKQKIKRQYAKAAREAKRTAKRAQAAGSYTAKAAKVLAGFVRRHPVAMGIILLLFLFFAVLLSMGGLASSMGGSGLGGVLGGAYLAENADIEGAEIAYTEWETDLREEIENVETDRPDYDEYRYEIEEIGHDPHILMSFLTAEYLNYTYADIADDLRVIFDEQYVLTYTETVETRYADPDDSDDDGDREPYDWKILTVKLEVTPLAEVIANHMDAEVQSHYEVLLETRGGRQYAGSPFAFDWTPYITSYYGWRPDPFTGEKSFHNGIDVGVAVGTPIIAAHDGVVTQVVNGTTGYGKQITVEGENGVSTRYAHCDAILATVGQEVAQGDVIAASGDTGNSTGPHLHFEVMVEGSTLNPIYFAENGE